LCGTVPRFFLTAVTARLLPAGGLALTAAAAPPGLALGAVTFPLATTTAAARRLLAATGFALTFVSLRLFF
jgi:hypothetical protein